MHCTARLTGGLLFLWWAATANADIEYYFAPNLNGQPTGCVQFEEIAPVSGPSDFRVKLSGSRVGCTPELGPMSAHAYLDRWGLGVLNPKTGSDRSVIGQVNIDGGNGGEYIRLEFEVPVRLTYLTFASAGSEDRFGLRTDGTDSVDMQALFPYADTMGNATKILDISQAQNNWPGHVEIPDAVPPNRFSSSWDVLITDVGLGDGIQLENVGVEPVPEPAMLMLWLSALAMAGLYAIRHRTKA